jgi:hypothetical protein
VSLDTIWGNVNPDRVKVLLLCDSHMRKQINFLTKRRIEFLQFRI